MRRSYFSHLLLITCLALTACAADLPLDPEQVDLDEVELDELEQDLTVSALLSRRALSSWNSNSAPHAVELRNGRLYWGRLTGLWSIAPSVGPRVTPVIHAPEAENRQYKHLTSDGSYLYAARTVTSTDFELVRMPLGGGTLQVLAQLGSVTGSLSVSNTDVYFIRGADILRVPKTGGTVSTFIPAASATSMAVEGDTLCWTYQAVRCRNLQTGVVTVVMPNGASQNRARVAGGIVYWSDREAVLKKASVTGGMITTLTSAEPGRQVIDLAVGSTSLYFIDAPLTGDIGQRRIRLVGLSGGRAQTLYGADLSTYSARGLHASGQQIYWADSGNLETAPGIVFENAFRTTTASF